MKKVSLFLLLIFISIMYFAENVSTQASLTQNVIVNVNITPQNYQQQFNEKTVTNINSSLNLGIGLTSPIIGTTNNIFINDKKFTKNLSGINWMLGFTKRNYFGDGLPTNGGSLYWEFGTVAIIVPYLGLGYDLRLGSAIVIGIGFPDVFHVNLAF